MSIAALRVTEERTYTKDHVNYHGVCGWLPGEDGARQRWYEYPGELPDIGELLKEAGKVKRNGGMAISPFRNSYRSPAAGSNPCLIFALTRLWSFSLETCSKARDNTPGPSLALPKAVSLPRHDDHRRDSTPFYCRGGFRSSSGKGGWGQEGLYGFRCRKGRVRNPLPRRRLIPKIHTSARNTNRRGKRSPLLWQRTWSLGRKDEGGVRGVLTVSRCREGGRSAVCPGSGGQITAIKSKAVSFSCRSFALVHLVFGCCWQPRSCSVWNLSMGHLNGLWEHSALVGMAGLILIGLLVLVTTAVAIQEWQAIQRINELEEIRQTAERSLAPIQ